jgi:hypothetical protein
MKFTENFIAHKVPESRKAVELHFLDTLMPESVLNKTENDYLFSEISIVPKRMTIELEDYIVNAKITNSQILDIEAVGINPIETLKNQLLSEFNQFYEKDLFQKTFNAAVTVDSNLILTGFKGWLYNLVGYRPKLYASHPNFLHKIIFESSRILQQTRISSAKWIVVSPKLACIFEDQSNFEYTKSNDVAPLAFGMTSHLGTWHAGHGFNVYVSYLIKDDWILIGRSPNSQNDKVITTIVGDDIFQHNKMLNRTLEEIHLVELSKTYKTVLIPGCETSYAKWNFVYKHETFSDWLINKVKSFFKKSE